MNKHTEGPWTAKPHKDLLDNVVEIVGPDRAVVARAYGWKERIGNIPDGSPEWLDKKQARLSEAEANAHLIAAAPELLEACKYALSVLTCQDGLAVEKLEQAISKAEGRA